MKPRSFVCDIKLFLFTTIQDIYAIILDIKQNEEPIPTQNQRRWLSNQTQIHGKNSVYVSVGIYCKRSVGSRSQSIPVINLTSRDIRCTFFDDKMSSVCIYDMSKPFHRNVIELCLVLRLVQDHLSW